MVRHLVIKCAKEVPASLAVSSVRGLMSHFGKPLILLAEEYPGSSTLRNRNRYKLFEDAKNRFEAHAGKGATSVGDGNSICCTHCVF